MGRLVPKLFAWNTNIAEPPRSIPVPNKTWVKVLVSHSHSLAKSEGHTYLRTVPRAALPRRAPANPAASGPSTSWEAPTRYDVVQAC